MFFPWWPMGMHHLISRWLKIEKHIKNFKTLQETLVTCIRWCHQTSKELPGRWKEGTPLSKILIRHISFSMSFLMVVRIGRIEENLGNLLMWDYFRFWAILRKYIIQHCIYNTFKIRPVQENKSSDQKQLPVTLKSRIKTMKRNPCVHMTTKYTK